MPGDTLEIPLDPEEIEKLKNGEKLEITLADSAPQEKLILWDQKVLHDESEGAPEMGGMQ